MGSIAGCGAFLLWGFYLWFAGLFFVGLFVVFFLGFSAHSYWVLLWGFLYGAFSLWNFYLLWFVGLFVVVVGVLQP
jgi:hypothetical protein